MKETSTVLDGTSPEVELLVDGLRHRLSTDSLLRTREPLARRNTLRVGGPAEVYVEPASEADLAITLSLCQQHQFPFFLLGRGSNLLVKDGGFRGVVVSLSHAFFCQIHIRGSQMHCGAGVRLKTVAVEAKRNNLSGLEFLEGIPGTIGGALRMNAGAMGSATFNQVESVRLMDYAGRVNQFSPRELDVNYRSCGALKKQIALEAVLLGEPDSRESIEERMNQFSRKRWQSQPAAPSAGCIFKNPVTIPAGKLIEELGLKGTRIGGARVSSEHGNFIVNDGTATAKDVLDLIELIRARAREVRKIELETEVEIIGE